MRTHASTFEIMVVETCFCSEHRRFRANLLLLSRCLLFYSELESFFAENKDKTELHAIYVVSGEVTSTDSTKGRKQRRTQLVRETELSNVLNTFDSVDTCEIYCLYIKPIKVYAADNI